ncbi:Uncharacterised protein [Legionella sainthelensi]|nr:Uncharacterised protein [Legionella sainthelensi]
MKLLPVPLQKRTVVFKNICLGNAALLKTVREQNQFAKLNSRDIGGLIILLFTSYRA